MNHARIINIEHHMMAVLVFFRASSGLVAVIALLGIVAATPHLMGYGVPELTTAPAAVTGPDPLEQGKILVRSQSEPLQTMVFYWVATPEQASRVDAMENDDTSDDWRSYRVIYARDDPELKAAEEALVVYMLHADETEQVSLIDARTW